MNKKIVKRVLACVVLTISIVAGFLAAKAQVTLNQSLSHITRDYDSALSSVDLSGIKVNSDNEIVNILLIGNDGRVESNGFEEQPLPDVMMIATMDKKHGTLKLTSLMRDLWVYIPDEGDYNKLNASMNHNGVKGLYKTIAQNLNIKLDGYVEVGFDGFVEAINAMGGVEVTLTDTEVRYLSQTNFIRKKKYRSGLKVGKQTLNGDQALGYCRIRKGKDVLGEPVVTANGLMDDYGRTWRQRTVISTVFSKMKTQSISKWIEIANKVMDNIQTDLSNDEIMSYMKSVVMMGATQVYQLQIPMNGYFQPSSDGSHLVPNNGTSTDWDITDNANILKQFVFSYDGNGDFDYSK